MPQSQEHQDLLVKLPQIKSLMQDGEPILAIILPFLANQSSLESHRIAELSHVLPISAQPQPKAKTRNYRAPERVGNLIFVDWLRENETQNTE